MEAKSLLIPIAAFALSATGVSAFNSSVLEKAGLTHQQISAFETAHELRKEGDKEAAREVLQEAGIDLKTMESVREALHEYKDALHTAVHEAVEKKDFEAFLEAIKDSPLADIVTTQEDFVLFSQAHKLHEDGNHKEAREILSDMGLEGKHVGHPLHKLHRMR